MVEGILWLGIVVCLLWNVPVLAPLATTSGNWKYQDMAINGAHLDRLTWLSCRGWEPEPGNHHFIDLSSI